MKCLWAGALLVLALGAYGQQQRTPQLPSGTTPTTAQPDKDIGRQMPPETKAKAPSSVEVQQQIQDKMNSEPGLASAKLKVEASSSTVVLRGEVSDDAQHQAARRIAESYAGPRKIVDRIRIKQ